MQCNFCDIAQRTYDDNTVYTACSQIPPRFAVVDRRGYQTIWLHGSCRMKINYQIRFIHRDIILYIIRPPRLIRIKRCVIASVYI